jgi:hypothetical protein
LRGNAIQSNPNRTHQAVDLALLAGKRQLSADLALGRRRIVAGAGSSIVRKRVVGRQVWVRWRKISEESVLMLALRRSVGKAFRQPRGARLIQRRDYITGQRKP